MFVRINPEQPEEKAILDAAALLEAGFLVVIPTDTVYGIAAHPLASGAKERIFKAKGRDEGKPIPILVSSADEAEKRGAVFGEAGRKLAGCFWPGPLTLVVPAQGRLEGFRVPDHPATLSLLKAAGGALYVTSANRSGGEPARTAEEAAQALGPFVKMVLDAGVSPSCEVSTVVKAEDEQVTILREGAIPRNLIESCVNF